MSHVTDKRSSPMWFPLVFASMQNDLDFVLFCPAIVCAFRYEMTRCEMIPDMFVVNVFSAVSHGRPSVFRLGLGFRFCTSLQLSSRKLQLKNKAI